MAGGGTTQETQTEYIFTGDVHPLNLGLSTGRYRVVSEGFGEITFDVTNSKVCGVATASDPVNRQEYLRHAIYQAVQGYMNVVAMKLGVHLRVDLQEITNVEKRSVTLLPLSTCFSIANQDNDKRAEFERLALQTFNTRHSNTIQRILADLNLALLDVVQSGFLCYRAIESMRGLFFDKAAFSGKSGDSDYWEAFREVTGACRCDIDRVKESADSVRHGDFFKINVAEYDWILKYTWELLFHCMRLLHQAV